MTQKQIKPESDFIKKERTKLYNKMVKEHKRLVNLYLNCGNPERKAFLGSRANLYRDKLIHLFGLQRAS